MEKKKKTMSPKGRERKQLHLAGGTSSHTGKTTIRQKGGKQTGRYLAAEVPIQRCLQAFGSSRQKGKIQLKGGISAKEKTQKETSTGERSSENNTKKSSAGRERRTPNPPMRKKKRN